MLVTWRKFHNSGPVDEFAVRSEILWNNEGITDGPGAPQCWPCWRRAGIASIPDICHALEGRLLSHIEIQQKFGVPCTFLQTLSLRMGIPIRWCGLLSDDFQGEVSATPEVSFPSGKILKIQQASAKQLYREMVSMGKPTPPAQRKWDLSGYILDSVE